MMQALLMRTLPLLLLPVATSTAQWDARRFAQTTLFFNGPQDVLKRLVPPPLRGSAPVLNNDGLMWSADKRNLLEWGPLDDVVMGGVSESAFTVTDGCGKFAGIIRTENNGGFAGCRSKTLSPPLSLTAYRGIRMKVRGDGQRYKAIIRDSPAWNGIAWAQSFDTNAGELQEVELLWADFVPTLFAKRVPGATLKTDEISTVQLTLSKFEYDGGLNPSFSAGPFCLEVAEIAALV